MSDRVEKRDNEDIRYFGQSDVIKSQKFYTSGRELGAYLEFFRRKDGKENVGHFSSRGSFTPMSAPGHIWRGNECYVCGDDKEKLYLTVEKGYHLTFYREDGKTVEWTRDSNGKETYYREDGKTVEYVRDSNGDETYYKKDGKTVDYYAKGGIKNNMLAENRKKLATKFGLRDVKLPRWAKIAEEKVSDAIEKAGKKAVNKTKTNTAQKPTRTNGGRS